ncbi:MAG TPA: hypothetical protein VG759_06540 [Candidatus Angelobacter sp.]|jgi:hypothetical protein|nr:hypothetical protein [Candidatus Angelobacter sp.]
MSTRALIVAISNYPKSTGEVATRIPDALSAGEKFYEWLTAMKGIPTDNIFVCADGGTFKGATRLYPTERERIVGAIVDLVNSGQDQTPELYVFFSGHGFSYQESPEKRTIEVLVASDFVSMAESGTKCIDLPEVQTKLYAFLGGQHHYYFVDACRTVITPEDIEPIPLGRKLGRPAQRGRPTRYTLFSTSFGHPAAINSRFAPALLEGLYGKGRAKGYTPKRELYVMFPLLAKYVKEHVEEQKVDENKEGSGDGYIVQIQPVPTYKCKIKVVDADPSDEFTLNYGPAGQPEFAKTVKFTGTNYELPYSPGDLALEIFYQGMPLRRLKPPSNQLLDFFDEASAEFEKPQASVRFRGGLEDERLLDSRTKGRPEGRGPDFPTVNLVSPQGVEIVARDLQHGRESAPMFAGRTTSLRQGTYEFAFRERGNTISKVIREVPETGAIEVQWTPNEVGRVRESIIEATAGNAQLGIVDFSETLEGPIVNRDLGLWLSLMGASHILQDPSSYSKLKDLRIGDFSTMLPDSSRIYLMAGFEPERQIAASVNRQPKRLAAIPGLHGVFQASFDAPPGSNLISIQLDHAEVRTYSSFCLPNRVTFMVISDDAEGRLAIKQFFLPVFHLKNRLDPMVRGRLNNEPPLKTMFAMYGFQTQFARGRRLDPPNLDDKSRWWDALYGKWLDPMTCLIVCYDIIRRGDEELKKTVRGTVVHNLQTYFPGMPDTAAIATLSEMDNVVMPTNPPLFMEGLAAFPDWEDHLPYPAKDLDYGATWTTWIGTEPKFES